MKRACGYHSRLLLLRPYSLKESSELITREMLVRFRLRSFTDINQIKKPGYIIIRAFVLWIEEYFIVRKIHDQMWSFVLLEYGGKIALQQPFDVARTHQNPDRKVYLVHAY